MKSKSPKPPESRRRGPKPLYGTALRQYTVRLPEALIARLRALPNAAKWLREVIERELG